MVTAAQTTTEIPGELISTPSAPGWYIARMKTWATYQGYAPVRVDDFNGKLMVWQCADERQWPVEAWDWRARIWP